MTNQPSATSTTDVVTTNHAVVDVPKFTSTELKQLRNNIKKLQTLDNQLKLKQTPYFDIAQLFSLKRTPYK